MSSDGSNAIPRSTWGDPHSLGTFRDQRHFLHFSLTQINRLSCVLLVSNNDDLIYYLSVSGLKHNFQTVIKFKLWEFKKKNKLNHQLVRSQWVYSGYHLCLCAPNSPQWRRKFHFTFESMSNFSSEVKVYLVRVQQGRQGAARKRKHVQCRVSDLQ